jgi:cobalamin biosynthesis Mg chelatase CobN
VRSLPAAPPSTDESVPESSTPSDDSVSSDDSVPSDDSTPTDESAPASSQPDDPEATSTTSTTIVDQSAPGFPDSMTTTTAVASLAAEQPSGGAELPATGVPVLVIVLGSIALAVGLLLVDFARRFDA